MRTVVITRPSAQARELERALSARGFEPFIFPTIAISPVDDPGPLRAALDQLERFRLVTFVSPNAIEHALAHLRAPWPDAVPLAVMGPVSRDTLARRGIIAPRYAVICPPEGGAAEDSRFDSEALFAALDIARLDHGPVLMIKGNGGRPWLAQRLEAAGIEVQGVESYKRSVPVPAPALVDRMRTLYEGQHAAQVIVTSSEGLANLVHLLEVQGGARARAWLQAQRLIVPHPRIAENATARGFTHVVFAGAGDSNIALALE